MKGLTDQDIFEALLYFARVISFFLFLFSSTILEAQRTRNLTKLCHMLKNEPDLQMHVQTFLTPPLTTGGPKTAYSASTTFDNFANYS